METRPPRPVRHFLEYVVLRIVVSTIQILPLNRCIHLARFLSVVVNDWFGIRRKTTDENLKNVFPELSEKERRDLSRRMWEHLVLMVCEVAHAPRKIHDSNWQKHVRIRDRKLITEYFLDWRPVVLVSGHFGNFELAVFITGILGLPTYAIARPLDNPWIHQWVKRFRESRGQFIFPSFGAAQPVQEVLDAGGILSLLGDQYAGTKGCWIDFLGRPAACHKALALFTLTGEAPMIVTYAKRTGGPLQFEIGMNGIADPKTLSSELKDVKSLTQWYNDRLGEIIRETPDQYWWLHRRWKPKPVRDTKKRRQMAA